MKRIIISIALFYLFLIILPQRAYAVDPYYNESYKQYIDTLKKVGDNGGISIETAGQTSLGNNMKGIIALSVGTTDASSAFYYKNSTLAQMGSAIVFMYGNPPANTYAFVRDLGQSFGFAPKKAYAADAQGSGYNGLLPILTIWKAFRNIAYGLLAIAMIIIGFMVMFRRKIDPKTVMTVQNALPRIIVTLLLISFSYAIAGFLIDLMYVLIFIGTEVLKNSGMAGIDVDGTQYVTGGFWALFAGVFSPLWNYATAPLVNAFSQLVTGNVLALLQEALATPAFIQGNIGALWGLIISLAYVFVFVRILFTLFSCYIQVLMDVIFAPIQLLMDVFPGSNQTANWFKHIISNLAAFPITIFMLILGGAIAKNFGAGLMWEPPLLNTGMEIGSVQIGQFKTGSIQVMGATGGTAYLGQVLIWFGILSSIPTIIRGLKEALKAKGPMQGGVGALTAPYVQTGSGVMGALQTFYYSKSIGESLGVIKPKK